MATGAEHRATRWLAIAEEEFVPTDSGGRVESLNMLRAAVAAGVRLHVIVPGLTSFSASAHRAALPGTTVDGIPRRTGWRSNTSLSPYIFASRPLPTSLIDRMKQENRDDPFDAVLSVSFRVLHLGRAVADALEIPLIVRPHNVESQYFAQLAHSSSFPRSLPYYAEAWKLRRAESAIHKSGGIAVLADISEQDARWRAPRTHTPVLHVPPFIPPPAAHQDDRPCGSSSGRTVLFVGALDNPNNVDAVRWFVEFCLPALREDIPSVDFHVVGRRAPAALVHELQACGARVTVDAPQVWPLLRAADVFVNPVQRGAGVNIKVVEAMAAGLAIVSTSIGARGVPWRDGEHLLMADGSADFQKAVRGLLSDPDERTRLGAAGRELVVRELDGVVQINRMRAAAGSPSSPHRPASAPDSIPDQ